MSDPVEKPKPNGTPTPYLVHCVKDEDFGSCGESSYLTEKQYDEQLSNPHRGCKCPQCGCHPCGWDDENYERMLENASTKKGKS